MTSRILILVLGAASLAGQVCWARIASSVVGGTSASAAITLSAAMAGLAAGAFLAGRWGGRRLLGAMILACSAALAALPWLILQIGHLEGSLALRRVLAAALLALAHLPFGAVLPCVVAWRRAPAAELYALGALGAAAGAALTGGFLAAHLALDRIGLLLAAVTLLSGALLRVPSADAPPAAPPRERTGRAPLAVAFILGLLGLAAESLWLRVLGFYWEAGTFTFALVTAATVGGLSLGSLVAGRLAPRRIAAALGLTALALTAAAAAAPLAALAATPGERIATALALVGLPSAFFGATFALLMDRASSRSLGLLTGANSVGAAAGPLLLWGASPWVAWAPQMLMFVAGGAAALIGAVSPRKGTALLLAGTLGLGAWGLAPAGPSAEDYRPFVETSAAADFDTTVFPFVRATLDSTVAVSRDTRTGVEVLWIDRSYQGDTSPLGRRIPLLLGRFPCDLLGRAPRRAMAIGLGTGLTLAGIVDGGAQSIEAVELSRGVIEANRTVLRDANDRVLERSQVRVRHGDGRPMLADDPEPYDLIVTDMVFPTAAGAANLFSREFYALARRRLTPDGLFVHWLPCFQLSPEDLSSVCAGFLEAFPDGSAWIGFLGPRRLILGLAGGAVRGAEREEVAARRALGPAELRDLAAGADPIRDADPRLEHRSRPRSDGSYGEANLRRVTAHLREPAWLRFAEAGVAEVQADLEPRGSFGKRYLRDRAGELYREAAAAAPGRTDAEFFLKNLAYERDLESAESASALRDSAGLLASLRRASAHPLYGAAHQNLAEALASRGRLDEAIGELEKAISKSPRSADAHLKLAMMALATGDLGRARRALESASALRPELPPLYKEMARRIGSGGS